MESVGDSYDNALAETINGLCKAEVIHRRGAWRNFEAVGLICNLLLFPVADWRHMTDAEVLRERALRREDIVGGDAEHAGHGKFGPLGILPWAASAFPS